MKTCPVRAANPAAEMMSAKTTGNWWRQVAPRRNGTSEGPSASEKITSDGERQFFPNGKERFVVINISRSLHLQRVCHPELHCNSACWRTLCQSQAGESSRVHRSRKWGVIRPSGYGEKQSIATLQSRAVFARTMSKSKNKSRGGAAIESRARRKRWAESVELLPKRAKFLLSFVVNV